jgi:hypothetical protein
LAIHQFTAAGCWFENSRSGIYRAATRHSVCFTGCYLHTFNHAQMMDFGDAAGYHFLGGNYFPADTNSQRIVNVNPDATGAVLGQPVSASYANTGAPAGPLMLPLQQGAGTVRTMSGTLAQGQELVLRLGRGTFFIGLNVWQRTNPRARSQATYSAFLCDGDNEAVVQIASHVGSDGPESFELAPCTNGVKLTYTGAQDVEAFISGAGAVG